MTTSPQDDHVLAQLYKEGAKNTPPAKLNYEIISYATNTNQNIPSHKQVNSHFDGGWKVPLSMAASIVIVFALLVQLDQSPQQLELPSIPNISIPMEPKSRQPQDNLLKSKPVTEKLYKTKKSLSNDISSKNAEQEIDKSQVAGQQMQESPKDVLSNVKEAAPKDNIQPRNVSEKPVTQGHEDTLNAPVISADTEIESDEVQIQRKAENEPELAPIPVEDWLLMIELLIARKDYAEADRQLVKFKQAHPKINVNDLDAKIP